MELVPIIYTALVIFAVLAIVTILISYILYKIKEKNGIDEEAGENLVLLPKPEFMKNSSTSKNKQKKHVPKSPIERNEKKEGRSSNRKSKQSSKGSKSKSAPIKENKRIKVLNQLQPKETKRAAVEDEKKDIKTTPATGINVKKYSEDDSEFYRLDTSRKKKK